MGKVEKKRKKLQDRIKELEDEMYMNLKQKTSSTAEISLADYQRKIADLRKQLALIA
jgi:ribosome-interacting GTPase 1